MTVDGVISSEYEDHTLMIVTARLSCPMLKEGRAFTSTFKGLWTWLNERYEKRSSKLIATHYLTLMAIKMSSSESVVKCISRADDNLSVLGGS